MVKFDNRGGKIKKGSIAGYPFDDKQMKGLDITKKQRNPTRSIKKIRTFYVYGQKEEGTAEQIFGGVVYLYRQEQERINGAIFFSADGAVNVRSVRLHVII